MSIETQAITMLLMVVCGIIMGLLYDTYRVMKGQTGIRGWIVVVCDLLFWASCLFLVFGSLLRVNDGVVSVYLFLGMGIGAWIYFRLFASFYIKLFIQIIRIVRMIYRFLSRIFSFIVVKPIVFVYRTTLALVIGGALFLWRFLGWVYRLIKKPLSPLRAMIGKWGKKAIGGAKKKGAGFSKRLAKLFKSRRRKEK